jgi:crotonobetainyl-CoA:carnitine CoA-transferase CaiB-like acyl-CoA transferase
MSGLGMVTELMAEPAARDRRDRARASTRPAAGPGVQAAGGRRMRSSVHVPERPEGLDRPSGAPAAAPAGCPHEQARAGAPARRVSGLPLPLQGLRVLDAGDFLAAPFCAMLLADWGADVVKVEPLGGDTARQVGEALADGVSPVFVSGNRGKRSVSIDLSCEQGRALLADLAAGCDVVVHNRTAAQAARVGLDRPSLARRRSDAIVGSVTAFGDSGPYAGRPALDPIAQAMSGMMSVTGPADGPPMRAGVTVVDFGAGLVLAVGVLAALWARDHTGEGRAVSTSLMEVGLLYSSTLFPLASALGGSIPRLENRAHPLLADQFAAADGFVMLAVWDERRWQALCELLGLPQLAADPRLDSNRARLELYESFRPALQDAIGRWQAAELIAALAAHGIVCGQTLDVAQVAADAHVRETGALYSEARLGTPFTMVASALHDDGRARRHPLPPPRLGEHTAEVLAEWLDLSPERVSELAAGGVVAGGERPSPA